MIVAEIYRRLAILGQEALSNYFCWVYIVPVAAIVGGQLGRPFTAVGQPETEISVSSLAGTIS